ncbi:hypothetical protein AB0X74_14095 [Kurthia gibsonii]|uniref:Lipoprotein n=2 Tax=Kurthia gibsonii TaxID=33946 RepID=A0ABU9LNA4_9BACL
MKKKILFLSIIVLLIIIVIFLTILSKEEKNKTKHITKKPTNYLTIQDEEKNKTIKLPYTEPTSYVTTEEFIYATVDDPNSDSISNQVIQINRENGKYKTIFHSKYPVAATQGLKADKEWIIWVDGDDFGENNTLYAFNELTQQTISFGSTDDKISKEFPEISGKYVTWTEHIKDTEKTSMILYDLEQQKEIKVQNIKNYEWLNSDYFIKNDNMVYVEKESKTAVLKTYDIKKNKLKSYPIPTTAAGWPTLVNQNFIAYVEYLDDEDLDLNKLMIYDLKNKKNINAFPNKNKVNIGYLKYYDENSFITLENNKFYIFTLDNNQFKKQILESKYNVNPEKEDITYSNNEFFILQHEVDSEQYKLIIDSGL